MVQSDAAAEGQSDAPDGAGIGTEALRRDLGGDATLDGAAPWLDLVLFQPQLLQRGPLGDAQLSADQVDPGDFLGDGMLDLAGSGEQIETGGPRTEEQRVGLHPGVHFNEVETVSLD